ncbi:hypothetical protein ABTX60_07080 [Streptomyces sp. NPDC126510]|uniref:hypothetical protein n=1 Tax=Streptomyces sp. NPDC126510 TaxID=3155317 RepID=UPI003332FF51
MSITSEILALPDSEALEAPSGPYEGDLSPLAASVVRRWGEGRHEGLKWQGFTFSSGIVKPDSGVVASVWELLNDQPTLGAAAIRVANLLPGNNRVDVVVDVGWDSPLTYQIMFLIVN